MGVVILALPPDLLMIAHASFAHTAHDVRSAQPNDLVNADFTGVNIVVVMSDSRVLTAALVAACDKAGTRIAPYAQQKSGHRLAAAFGLAPLTSLDADQILSHPVPRSRPVVSGGITAIWGPPGSPGRSSVAASLAVEIARAGERVALIDADSHAPALAIMLGLTDDGPGFASACRTAERLALDANELTRVSQRLPLEQGSCVVLTGINRPNRWPELGAERVAACLDVARGWVEHVIVDVAASLEEDEEIMSDIDAPRRNAATLATLRAADHIVAVASADAVGMARFVRAYADLKTVVGEVPIFVVINRVRSASVGIDARGQIRRTLSRYAGIDKLIFLPNEPEVADGAILHARAMSDIAPKSAFASGIRRLVPLISPGAAAVIEPDQQMAVGRRDRRRHRRTGELSAPSQLG